jgi:hypothetical protein
MIIEESPRVSATETPLTRVDAFLRKARASFREASQAEVRLRTNQLDDLRFRASEQWPDAIQAQRARDGRPCLTINRLPQFIRQITNQQRENKPAITVSPVDDQADIKTADVLQGMIRHIETRSHAHIAYTTAGDHQATIGRGWIRILTEYLRPDSFEQSLTIKRVRNPFTIYPDPACQELDASDARYMFVVADLTEAQFAEQYGQDTPGASLADFQTLGDERADWMLDGGVRIAEYWYVEQEKDDVLFLATGETILRSQVPDIAQIRSPDGRITGVHGPQGPILLVRSRPTVRKTVKWATINGLAVLDGHDDLTEGREWPGQWIPLVPVIGDEIDINGRVDLRGIVRDAKDPQRRYNYSVSAATETAALAPRAPFIAAKGQLEGHEEQWAQANVRNFSVLEYNPTSLDGHLVGPPQRNVVEPPIQAMVLLTSQADNDLKSVTGFFDASLGAPGPEQSGKAILARQRQGDIGSYNYQDNLNVALATLGRYLVDLIPKVYDRPRILRIVGSDNTPKTVMVHAGPDNAPPAGADLMGIEGVYDLSAGLYDVSVSAGPSYQSRRQEATAAITQFVQAYPNAFPMIGDLLAKNMDWPGAQEISERLQKLLPPELRPPGPDGQPQGQAAPPPEMVQQLQQAEQQLQQMGQQLQQVQQALQTQQAQMQSSERMKQLEMETKRQIAEMQAQVGLAKVQATQAAVSPDSHRVPIVTKQMDTESKERIAQTQADALLAKTQMEVDGAMRIAMLEAHVAEITARLDQIAASERQPSGGD